jgi:hypothetical protein
MATIPILAQAGTLTKLDPALDPAQQELRIIYLSDRAKKWLDETLPSLGSTWNIEEAPSEQLDALFAIFTSGEILAYGDHFKPLRHIKYGVWELKTADLRMIGWFPHKDCFVAVVADTADRVKKYNLYQGYIGEVVRFRDALDLDEPKFVAGEDPKNVVSDFNYTQ